MKEDFKKYLKSNEEVKKIYKQVKQEEEDFWRSQNEVTEYLKNHSYQEADAHFKKAREEKQKKQDLKIQLYEKQKKASLKNNLLLNNFIYKFLENKQEAFKNIINKYENKNIGEKTKEKIKEEIKEEVKTIDFLKKAEIYPYFSGDFKNYDLSIEIREKKQDVFIYDIKIQFTKKTSYNSYEDKIKEFYYTSLAEAFSYNYYCINDLLYIEDIQKEVKRIIKEEKTKKEKIEKLKNNLKEEVKKYNNFISMYNLNAEKTKSYKIDTTLYLY